MKNDLSRENRKQETGTQPDKLNLLWTPNSMTTTVCNSFIVIIHCGCDGRKSCWNWVHMLPATNILEVLLIIFFYKQANVSTLSSSKIYEIMHPNNIWTWLFLLKYTYSNRNFYLNILIMSQVTWCADDVHTFGENHVCLIRALLVEWN